MKFSTVLTSFAVTIIFCGCKSTGKISKTSATVSKPDTIAVIVPPGKENIDSIVKLTDSTKIIKEVYNKVIANKINYSTFNAKVKVGYNGKDGAGEGTALIRMKKDSVIWLSFRGPLGIEGFRVLITEDSVKLMNGLKKWVQHKEIQFLQQVTGFPLDFSTLQDMIVGNPIYIDSNINTYKIDSNNYLTVAIVGKAINNIITIDNSDFKILESRLEENRGIVQRSCNIKYSSYNNERGIRFSTERKITVAQHSKLDVNLNFKQYAFNEPLRFPFNIPGNYKRL